IRGFKVAGVRKPARRELDGLVEEAQRLGAGGLVWMVREGDEIRSPVAKFLDGREVADTLRAAGLQEGEVLVMAAGGEETNAVLSGIRDHCVRLYPVMPERRFSFVWVTPWRFKSSRPHHLRIGPAMELHGRRSA
ncbi:MAG: hypothetical protein K6U88_14025, partial [Dehalococcoidia bacterium]|nr:hypothetical protein [Dehalococcoidia bacterium]